MALTPGTRLGPYEISTPIGAGGMGEVYAATDVNLARQVAIKVLPDAVAARLLFEGPFRADGPFRGYDVTPDGQGFLMVRAVEQPPARITQMVLVQNWFQELKAKAPTK